VLIDSHLRGFVSPVIALLFFIWFSYLQMSDNDHYD